MTDYEQPATSGEAPAEFALVEELADESAEAVEANAEPATEPVAPPAEQPMPGYEQPANSGEAPARIRLDRGATLAARRVRTARRRTRCQQRTTGDRTASGIAVRAAPRGRLCRRNTGRAAQDEALSAEPTPFAEPVADEPEPPQARPPSWLDEPALEIRHHPLRFLWQMDAEGRFSLGSGEFIRLIGARTAARFGRPWSEIADSFALDPEGRVLKAFATRDTWSGITLNWPADGGGRLPVELSGLPVYDAVRNFAGYRGFGVCRDLDGLTRLAALRRFEAFSAPAPPQTHSADIVPAEPATNSATNSPSVPDTRSADTTERPAPGAGETSPPTDVDTRVETPIESPREIPGNVLPFRPLGEPKSTESKSAILTPVENSAFNELARQLSARLETEHGAVRAVAATSEEPAAEIELPTRAGARRTGRLAGAARTAAARRSAARPHAARPRARRRPDLSARPAGLCQSGVPRPDGLRGSARAGGCRRARRALCRARRLQRQQHLRHRHAGDDFGARRLQRACSVAGDRRTALHHQLGRRAGAGADLLAHRDRGRGNRRRDRAGPCGTAARRVAAIAGRPRQCRGTRRHPRYHGRRHRDVRRRGQSQFVQPQRRSAVRS